MHIEPTPISIQNNISENLNCEYINVEGDGRHFFATIVSNAFFDKSRIMRHQIIYSILGERMKEEIHALSMKTFTPIEWANEQSKS
jgi:acid stress-induced BolA-like protein IbaG/YrbA